MLIKETWSSREDVLQLHPGSRIFNKGSPAHVEGGKGETSDKFESTFYISPEFPK